MSRVEILEKLSRVACGDHLSEFVSEHTWVRADPIPGEVRPNTTWRSPTNTNLASAGHDTKNPLVSIPGEEPEN